MTLTFRTVNKEDLNEMRFIAKADSRIPLEYDSNYTFTESSIDSRLEFYLQLSNDDFFEVASYEKAIVAFHIVKANPNFHVGDIITLWVHPDYRGQSLAAQLKIRAETWAKSLGMIYLQTNVHKSNKRMLKMNETNGYESTYINMRKKL